MSKRVFKAVTICAPAVGVFFSGYASAGVAQELPAQSADWPAWVQAIGSILAIFVAIAVSYWQNWQQVEREKQKEAQEVDNILRGIRDEVQVLWLEYMKKIGCHLLATEVGQPFRRTWPGPENPFFVYDGCKGSIGKIADHEQRRRIIVTYALAQGLLLSYRFNSAMLERFEVAQRRYCETNLPADEEIVRQISLELATYGDALRESHEEVASCIDELLEALPKQWANRSEPHYISNN